MSDASSSQRRAGSPPASARPAQSAQLAGAQGPRSAKEAIQVMLAAMGDVLNRRISTKEATATARLGESVARVAQAAPEVDATLADGTPEIETPTPPSPEHPRQRELRIRKQKLESELAALNGELE
jgi:hypothetical protein